MSKKCWVFGDSFQASSFPPGQESSWVDILFAKKGYEVINHARAGLSTEAIILLCIDCLDDIHIDDYVLVCLSAHNRYMAPYGTGDIHDTQFTRYADTNLNHPCVWKDFEKSKDTNILNIADTYNTSLGGKLKASIWNNYITMLLKEKGVKFKIIHGHYEPLPYDIDSYIEFMPDAVLRINSPNVTKYYDLSHAMKFDSGLCLINDFFNTQLQHLIIKFNDKDTIMAICNEVNMIIESKKTMYHEGIQIFFINRIIKDYGIENSMFFDSWHLSPRGQEIYAEYAEKYDWGV